MKKFIIIGGIHKAGTTSLFTHLARHPEVNFSKVKETHYFSSHLKIPNKYYDSRIDHQKFSDFFDKNDFKNNLFLEASPEYLYSGDKTIHKIKKEIGDKVKLIFILRNPADKIFSEFNHKKSALKLSSSITFDEYKKDITLEDENYHQHLLKWYENFDEQNIKIIFFDNLKNDALEVFRDISFFLDINPIFFKEEDLTIENKTTNFRNKTLHKIAIFFNINFEFFLKKNFFIKKIIRNIYRKINSKNNKKTINQSSYNDLNEKLIPCNKKLRKLLLLKGYKKLPEWLN